MLGNDSKYITYEKGQGHEAVLFSYVQELDINVSFLLDYLRGKVIALYYYNYLSDTKTEFMDGGVRLYYERHYLKPINGIKPKDENENHFGNVLLENCVPTHQNNLLLKIMVTPYPQAKVQPFSILMKALLS